MRLIITGRIIGGIFYCLIFVSNYSFGMHYVDIEMKERERFYRDYPKVFIKSSIAKKKNVSREKMEKVVEVLEKKYSSMFTGYMLKYQIDDLVDYFNQKEKIYAYIGYLRPEPLSILTKKLFSEIIQGKETQEFVDRLYVILNCNGYNSKIEGRFEHFLWNKDCHKKSRDKSYNEACYSEAGEGVEKFEAGYGFVASKFAPVVVSGLRRCNSQKNVVVSELRKCWSENDLEEYFFERIINEN